MSALISNIRKAPRREKYLQQSILVELHDGLSMKQYLDEQARLDEEDREEEMRFQAVREEEQRRIEEEEENDRWADAFFDWDDQYDPFY